MPNDRTDQIYDWWKQAAEKYDYFMAGVCLAITGYLGQNLKPGPLGFNASTLEVVSILALAAASFCALKRIQTTAHLLRLQLSSTDESEKHTRVLEVLQHEGPVLGNLTGQPIPPAELQQRADAYAERRGILDEISRKVMKRAPFYFAARDNLLIVGIVLLVIARVWAGQATAPISSSSAPPGVATPAMPPDESHHRAVPPNPAGRADVKQRRRSSA